MTTDRTLLTEDEKGLVINKLPDVVSLGLLLGLALLGVVTAIDVVCMVAKLIITVPFYVHVLFLGILWGWCN